MTAVASPVSRRFACEPGEVRAARRFVAANVPPEHCDDATLLVSELAANAVLHARTPFSVEIRVEPRVVRVDVVDHDSRPAHRRPNDPLADSGRGIAIVEVLAARWGCEPFGSGKRCWFELDR